MASLRCQARRDLENKKEKPQSHYLTSLNRQTTTAAWTSWVRGFSQKEPARQDSARDVAPAIIQRRLRSGVC